MLQITPHHTIIFSINYVDFRKGIDGLCSICRDHLNSDPIEGAVLYLPINVALLLKYSFMTG